MAEQRFDDAVVGAGILGLAHAYHLARRGRKVLVLEKSGQAQGASIRNFGMLWPVGQPAGEMYQMARRSRAFWGEVLRESGLWHAECGSLHLAYHADEAQVLEEFLADPAQQASEYRLLSAAQIAERFPRVRQQGLHCGLWSPHEACVDPRQVIAGLPDYLHRTYGVQFAFDCKVTGIDAPTLYTTTGTVRAENIVVCSGDDFQTLYPEIFVNSGLVRCKLQMLRSQPYGAEVRIGTHLAAGLTLRHYRGFATCPTLPVLDRRLHEQYPDYIRYGIHVMASQNGLGEIVIGDSHEYSNVVDIFNKQEIDDLILTYLNTFLDVPDLTIAARWYGVYAKHPTASYLCLRPAEQVTVVTGVGGAGMTLSFGLAEKVISDRLL